MRHDPFPDDLVTAQEAWTRTYEELARPRPAGVTDLRRRLIRLSVQVYFHPFWTRQAHPSTSRGDLLHRVRAGRPDREETAA
ncbi:hypothetical protein ACFT0G_36745 [Streptomyces sp. NPDC057020]|uniref:hypothetical protein n=1 Tax=unclassified Streptomyces TaxID=2593676 RepID=UPI00364144D1